MPSTPLRHARANSSRLLVNSSRGLLSVGSVLCLTLTIAAPSRAESPQSESLTGVTARVGSVAGTTEFRDEDVITIGVAGAIGYRIGPAVLELEHERGLLLEGRTGVTRGRTVRSSINARLFAFKITQPFDSDTMLRLYIEGGLGHSQGVFSSGDQFARGEQSVGGGFLLDHRSARVGKKGLHFAGWHLGWSLRFSDPTTLSPSVAASCKKGACMSGSPASGTDVNLMFGSAVNFAW